MPVMKRTLQSFFFAIPLAVLSTAGAQTTMDITLVPGQNNDLEVRLRPDMDFDGLVAGMVFTVRWSNASGASLGSEIQDATALDVCNVSKSGPEQVVGDYRYQVYVAFSLTPLSEISFVLLGGQEYTLCKLPILNAADAFVMVNDDWTAVNNADYFISLNGADGTGLIYDQSTGSFQGSSLSNERTVSVWPNPVTDQAVVSFGPHGSTVTGLDLLDAAGRVVWSKRSNSSVSETMDMKGMPSGAYVLRLTVDDGTRSLIVLKR